MIPIYTSPSSCSPRTTLLHPATPPLCLCRQLPLLFHLSLTRCSPQARLLQHRIGIQPFLRFEGGAKLGQLLLMLLRPAREG